MQPRKLPLLLLLAPLPFVRFAVAQGATPGNGIPGVGEPGGPVRDLAPDELARFLRGRALFDHDFRPSEGLGSPEINADSCRGCHQDPVLGGAGGLELNVSRFASDAGGFQDLPGGQGLSKLRPPTFRGREEYDALFADVFEQRQTPSLLGAGLLDGVPDGEILAHEDATDADGDGVFGIARVLTVDGATEIGRFGWKAQIPHLADFVKDAMGGELGITTTDDARGFARLTDLDARPDPELGQPEVDDVFFFLATLAEPKRVGSLDPMVTEGERIFGEIGCATCHPAEIRGASGPVKAYTDLLLHDVMSSLYRGMQEPGAPIGFFRTPPLWGVRNTAPYMHDGRAENLHDAIVAHEGEALRSLFAYIGLSKFQKDEVVAFLKDL